eukprot:scpid110670/ scgid15732/ 
MVSPHRLRNSLLVMSRVHNGGLWTLGDVLIPSLVLGDCQNGAQGLVMKAVNLDKVVFQQCPALSTIQQDGRYAGRVGMSLGAQRQVFVQKDTLQSAKSTVCLSNTSPHS